MHKYNCTLDRKPFHKKCVKCRTCGKALTPATLNEHETQLYCNVSMVIIIFSISSHFVKLIQKFDDFFVQPCYENIFIAHDYVCGKYGGIVTPEVGFMTMTTMMMIMVMMMMMMIMMMMMMMLETIEIMMLIMTTCSALLIIASLPSYVPLLVD